MYKLALMFVSLLFLIGAPASAAGANQDRWVVTQLSGDARIVHPGVQPTSVRVNSQLAAGDTLLTGPTGRATLVRGGDYIVVAPHSELRLPSTPQPTGFTRVIQNLGTLLFKVQHTGIPHFAVDTPMLAAVVKGTTFTVVVDQQRSAVQVIQGAVQVSALDGGMSRIVEGGRTVFINHSAPKVLLDADKAAPASPAPSAHSVTVSAAGESPLTSIATLTGGLVRADLTAPQPTAATVATAALPIVRATQPGTSSQPAAPTGTSAATTPAATVVATTPAATVVTSTPAATVVVGTTTTPAVTSPSITVSSVTTPTVTATTTVIASTVTVASVTTPTVTIPSTTTPTVTVPSTTTPTVTVASTTTPTVSVPSTTTPTVTVPSVTTSVTTTPTVTVPSLTTASNSGPGSLNSGSGSLSSGSGSLNSGPGSLSSGSGSLNSGPGSLSSGSGSGSTAPLLTISSVTTPTVTIPSTTTPVVPLATPTVTVPSLSTPTVTIPSLKF